MKVSLDLLKKYPAYTKSQDYHHDLLKAHSEDALCIHRRKRQCCAMWCSRIRDVFKPQVENRVAQFELASRLVLGCIPEKYHKSLYIYGHSVKYLCGKENGIERLEEGRNIKVIDFIAFVYQSIPLFNDEFSMLYYRSCVEYKDISPLLSYFRRRCENAFEVWKSVNDRPAMWTQLYGYAFRNRYTVNYDRYCKKLQLWIYVINCPNLSHSRIRCQNCVVQEIITVSFFTDTRKTPFYLTKLVDYDVTLEEEENAMSLTEATASQPYLTLSMPPWRSFDMWPARPYSLKSFVQCFSMYYCFVPVSDLMETFNRRLAVTRIRFYQNSCTCSRFTSLNICKNRACFALSVKKQLEEWSSKDALSFAAHDNEISMTELPVVDFTVYQQKMDHLGLGDPFTVNSFLKSPRECHSECLIEYLHEKYFYLWLRFCWCPRPPRTKLGRLMLRVTERWLTYTYAPRSNNKLLGKLKRNFEEHADRLFVDQHHDRMAANEPIEPNEPSDSIQSRACCSHRAYHYTSDVTEESEGESGESVSPDNCQDNGRSSDSSCSTDTVGLSVDDPETIATDCSSDQ